MLRNEWRIEILAHCVYVKYPKRISASTPWWNNWFQNTCSSLDKRERASLGFARAVPSAWTTLPSLSVLFKWDFIFKTWICHSLFYRHFPDPLRRINHFLSVLLWNLIKVAHVLMFSYQLFLYLYLTIDWSYYVYIYLYVHITCSNRGMVGASLMFLELNYTDFDLT